MLNRWNITRLKLCFEKFKFLTAYLNSMQAADKPSTCNNSNAPTPQTKELTVEPISNTAQNPNIELLPLTSIQNRNKTPLSQVQKNRAAIMKNGNKSENILPNKAEEAIVEACDTINHLLQKNHYSRIQMVIYPQFCRMFNIDQLKDTITNLIENAHNVPANQTNAHPSQDTLEKKVKENEQIIERLEAKVLHLERNSMSGMNSNKISLLLEKEPLSHVINRSITEKSSPITFPIPRSDFVSK